MLATEYVMALVLLAAPCDSMDVLTAKQYAHLRISLQEVAMHLEIMDPRERRYML